MFCPAFTFHEWMFKRTEAFLLGASIFGKSLSGFTLLSLTFIALTRECRCIHYSDSFLKNTVVELIYWKTCGYFSLLVNIMT